MDRLSIEEAIEYLALLIEKASKEEKRLRRISVGSPRKSKFVTLGSMHQKKVKELAKLRYLKKCFEDGTSVIEAYGDKWDDQEYIGFAIYIDKVIAYRG